MKFFMGIKQLDPLKQVLKLELLLLLHMQYRIKYCTISLSIWRFDVICSKYALNPALKLNLTHLIKLRKKDRKIK